MAVFRCDLCDRFIDIDFHGVEEWGGEEVCSDCYNDHTPEDVDDWKLSYWKKPIPDRGHDWELTHKDYDGPGDPRAFTGRSVEDVYQQAIEYNEEQDND